METEGSARGSGGGIENEVTEPKGGESFKRMRFDRVKCNVEAKLKHQYKQEAKSDF